MGQDGKVLPVRGGTKGVAAIPSLVATTYSATVGPDVSNLNPRSREQYRRERLVLSGHLLLRRRPGRGLRAAVQLAPRIY